MNGGRRGRPRRLAPPRKPRSKEDPREAKARDRARIPGLRRENAAPSSPRPGPARQPDPLPDQARHAPLLRANPYSEVTDPICRLPLPTLFYRLETLHLGDQLRILVRPVEKFACPHHKFSRSEEKISTQQYMSCSSSPSTISLCERLPW